ncbi:MAG: MCE family protein [Armatimonadetes bacterium]|nr:MCE family protein [Armatimonadota bacterium]
MGLNKEARAGLIATILILAVGYTISVLTSIQQQKEWGTPYHIIFNRIEALEEGSAVMYNGRLVGRVRKIDLRPQDQRVDVTIAIRPFQKVELTKQSHYRIHGRFFGQRWIAIHYEPGEIVPANGEVAGESVPRLTHMFKHGIDALERAQQQLTVFKKEYGDPATIRKQMTEGIKQYNDIAFEVRAQINNFNRFAHLANTQLDKMADRMIGRMQNARLKARLGVERLRAYSVTARSYMHKGEDQFQDMVGMMKGRVAAMRGYVKEARAFLAEQKKIAAQLHAMRKKADEYAQLAEALRFMQFGPQLATQLKERVAEMRKSTLGLRNQMDAMNRKKPADTGTQGGASPSPSPSAAVSPSVGASPGASPAASPPPEIAPSPVPTEAQPEVEPISTPSPSPEASTAPQ